MIVTIGLPAYDGRVVAPLVDSLLAEQFLGIKQGVHLIIDWEIGCGLIHVARNRIANRFLQGKTDALVFVDSDMSWKGGDLVRLAKRKQDVVGGTYRTKTNEEVRFHVRGPVRKRGELWNVHGLPTGFLKISRRALEKIDAKPYRHSETETHYDFFPTGVSNRMMWGEDYGFCRLWLKSGGKIWLDPTLTLRHHDGMQVFAGDVGEWLKTHA